MILDDPVKLEDQAKQNGWSGGLFSFGKAEQPRIDYLNPGIVRRPDGLWLLARRSEPAPMMDFGFNGIWAFKLDENRAPIFGKRLQFTDAIFGRHQFEDPRAVQIGEHTYIGACNFIWFGPNQWTGAHQVVGVFDKDWQCFRRFDPDIDGNGNSLETRTKHQKNWTYFVHEGRLHLLYSTQPWLIIEFGEKWKEQRWHGNPYGVQWPYGVIRGGTPPILFDGLFWTFFHSSIPWKGRYRRYVMGAIAFESKPPFKPMFYTPEPLLVGSQADPWAENKPLVVFPCGAILENEKWFITYGVNDLACGWCEIPHEDLLTRVVEVPNYCRELMIVQSLNGKEVDVQQEPETPAPQIKGDRRSNRKVARKKRIAKSVAVK